MVRVRAIRQGGFYASNRTMGYGRGNGSNTFDNGREVNFRSVSRRNNSQYERARVAVNNRTRYLRGEAFNRAYEGTLTQAQTLAAANQYQRYSQMISRAARNMHAAADRNLGKAAMGGTVK